MSLLIETRPYFVLGDLIANLASGAVAGAAMAVLFGPEWNMFLAMLAGMALGMAITLPLAFLFGAFFGAMEIMVPVMTTGMVAGMVVSMGAAMEVVSPGRGAVIGALSGLAVMVVVYIANSVIRRGGSKWTS